MRELSCPARFNLCKGLAEVLLVVDVYDAKQEISVDIVCGAILEIGQIYHNLLVSLDLLHDDLNCQLRASWNFERNDLSTKKVLFLATENIFDEIH